MHSLKNNLVTVTLIGLILFVLASYFSIKIGAYHFTILSTMDYLFSPNQSELSIILHDIRLPRLVITILAGANLAVAGAMMQGITRNPLASPSVLGINAGASFVIVLMTVLFPSVTGYWLIGSGFLGGLAAASLIFLMSFVFKGGAIEVKIALVGIAIQALFSSGTQSLLLFNEDSINKILVWLAGMLAGTTWDDVRLLLPISISALIASLLLAKSLSVLVLGDDVAKGLGQRIILIKGIVIILVVLLAGSTVATVGPIGFVGLIVPHLVRFLIGTDYRKILPLSALFGANLLLIADVLSRFIAFPSETPVGIVTALIGTPYFIYLARTKKSASALS
ncbi:FecCD family ABC transporter permease [Niallia sp. 03133]|uniref:FecCD family ABC transporter permease n=1 Tax=Niallia sp. 03133 TaxID=3458060 RepID=UPI00404409AA